MGYTQLGSREYKVMLRQSKFRTAKDLKRDARVFWAELVAQPAPGENGLTIGNVLGLPTNPGWREKTGEGGRHVRFYDDEDGALDAAEYVLRRRGSGNKAKITLKRRSADRVIACGEQIDLDGAKRKKPAKNKNEQGSSEKKGKKPKFKVKFEEDIKLADDSSGEKRARLRSLFGLSVDLEGPSAEDLPLESVKKVEKLFPGFKSAVRLKGSTELKSLRRAPVQEHVLELETHPTFLGGEDSSASAALVAWYADGPDEPSVVEFSYKHEGSERDFCTGVARNARTLLMILGALEEWRPDENERLTKTKWIYNNRD